MAINANLDTTFGETRELYVRVNNVEVSNHTAPSVALVRGFLSEQCYRDGKPFVFEHQVEFDADVALPLWPQAYAAIKALPACADAVDC